MRTLLAIGVIIILLIAIAVATMMSRRSEAVLVSGKLLCSLVTEPEFGPGQSCTLGGKTLSPVEITLVVQGLSGNLSGRVVSTGLPGSPYGGSGSGCGGGLVALSSNDFLTFDGTWSVVGSLSGNTLSLSGTLQQINGTGLGASRVTVRADFVTGLITLVIAAGSGDYPFIGLGTIQVQDH